MNKTYLKKIQSFYKKYKRLPSYSEMLSLFNLSSKNSIHKIVKKLLHEHYLEQLNNKLAPGENFFQVPILGTVKAGFPTGVEEEISALSLDEYLIDKPNSSFILKVSGDSLEGIGILKGDLVILEKTKQANIGNVVLALIDNEWTLKIFGKKDGKPILKSANPNYPDFKPENELQIFGIVKSVIRKY